MKKQKKICEEWKKKTNEKKKRKRHVGNGKKNAK
jgi:hypothetical protein